MSKDLFDYRMDDVFLHIPRHNPKRKSYWKVIKVEDTVEFGYKAVRYTVRKCTKTGKTFKDWKSFVLNMHDKPFYVNEFTYIGNFNGVAPVKDGTKEGVRKRRIRHLKETIARMQKELERLENAQ